jgi:tetratricopeptide (TPR) repeat protein
MLLAGARAALAPEAEAAAAHTLGLIDFKLGDALAARAHFGTSLRIWRTIRGYAEDILTEEVNCAVTSYHLGQLDEARAGLDSVRRNGLMESPAAQAEILAALAMVEARAGDRDAAEARAREARTLADEGGEPGAQVRVLRSLGEARLLVGDAADARSLFAKALALIAEIEASDGGEVPPEDAFGVLVGSLDASADPAPTLASAVERAPLALHDPSAWWDLPRLLPHVARALARGEAIECSEVAYAARQRPDCRAWAAAFAVTASGE